MDTPPTTTSGAVAVLIKTMMADQGLSMKALSASTGITRPTLIRRFAGGIGSEFRLDELDAIASALQTTTDQLVRQAAVRVAS